MAKDRIAKSVLELITDASKYYAELDKAEQRGKKFGTNIENDVGKSMDRLEQRSSKLGATLRTTFGAALTTVGGLAVAAGLEYEKASAIIVRATGATGAALKGLQDDMKVVIRQVPESAEVVATTLSDIHKRIGLTGSALQVATKSFLDFARVNRVDVAESTRSVTQFMNDLGVSADRLPEVLDKLTAASQASGVKVTDLANSISQVDDVLAELGFGLDESIALFAQLERAGAEPTQAITSLNLAIKNMAKEGVTDAQQALTLLMDRIKSAPTLVDASKLAVQAFGRSGVSMAADIRSGKFEIEGMLKVVQDAPGTLDRTAKAAETTGEKFARWKNIFTANLEPIGSFLLSLGMLPLAISAVGTTATTIFGPLKTLAGSFITTGAAGSTGAVGIKAFTASFLGPLGLIAVLGAAAAAFTIFKTRQIQDEAETMLEAGRILGRAADNITEARRVVAAFDAGKLKQPLAETERSVSDLALAWLKGAQSAGQLGDATGDATIKIKGFGKETKAAGTGTLFLTDEQKKLNKEIEEFRKKFTGADLQKEARMWAEALKDPQVAARLTVEEFDRLQAILVQVRDKFGSLEAAGVESLGNIRLQVRALRQSELRGLDVGFSGFFQSIQTDAERLKKLFSGSGLDLSTTPGFISPLPFFRSIKTDWEKGLAEIKALDPADLSGLFPKEGWFQSVDKKTGFFSKSFGGAKQFGTAISETVMQSLTGGGSPLRATSGLVGSGLASGIVGSFSKTFASTFIGSTLGAILPGIGALAGPIMEKVVGAFDRNKGRDTLEKWWNATFGGAAQMRSELVRVLGDVEAEKLFAQMASVGRNNVKQAEAAIQAVERAMEEAGKKTAEFNSKLQTSLQRVKELGGGIPDALKPLLDGLRESKKLSQENIDLLAELASGGTVDWRKLEEAAGRYGVKTDKLGKAFNEAKMHEAWQQIIDDIDLFERGSVDVNGLLSDMADEISALVQTSIKFGTEIPENMRPWIEKLIEAGELVDEDGRKITDIGKLKFGETLQTSLQRLILEIEKLILTLGGVPGAVAAIPSEVNVDVNYRERRVPAIAEGEIFDTSGDVFANPRLMQHGGFGRVTTPTLFMAGVHGPEDFAFSGENKSFADAPPPPVAGPGDVTVVVVDGSGSTDDVIDRTLRVLPRKTKYNELGFRTAMREALGIVQESTA